MCGSMVVIQSATAEIRRGIKKIERRNHRTESVSRSNALAQGERRGIGWCVQCVRDVQGRKVK